MGIIYFNYTNIISVKLKNLKLNINNLVIYLVLNLYKLFST